MTGLCAAALVSLLAVGLATADESHVHADHRQLSSRKDPTRQVRACTTIVVSTWNPSCTRRQYRRDPASCAEAITTSGTRQLFDCREVSKLKLRADTYQNTAPAGLTVSEWAHASPVQASVIAELMLREGVSVAPGPHSLVGQIDSCLSTTTAGHRLF